MTGPTLWECPVCGRMEHSTCPDRPLPAECPDCGWSEPAEAVPETPRDPSHYEGDGRVTCADALRSMTHGCGMPPMRLWWWGCAFKYLWRWPRKNGAEDLRKAKDCIERLLADVEGGCE